MSITPSDHEFGRMLAAMVEREVASRISVLVHEAVSATAIPLIDSAVAAKTRGIGKSLELMSDDVRSKVRNVQVDQDALLKAVGDAKANVVTQLDALEEKVKKKANSVLLPAATVLLIGGFLALWATAGSLVISARTEAQTSLDKLQVVRERISAEQDELKKADEALKSLSGDIASISAEVDRLRQGTALDTITKQLATLSAKIDLLNKPPQRQNGSPTISRAGSGGG